MRFVSQIVTSGSPLSQTVTLAAGANTISSGGILVTSSFNSSTTGTVASNFTITGGTLTSGNGQDLIVNDFGTASGSSITIASQITGPIGLTIAGYTQALAGAGGTVIISNGANNYTGPTAISAATTLQTAAPGAIPSTSAVLLSLVATLNLNGNNQSIGSLSSP